MSDMVSCRCLRCNHYWSCNVGGRERFQVITRFCPACVGLLPRMGDA